MKRAKSPVESSSLKEAFLIILVFHPMVDIDVG